MKYEFESLEDMAYFLRQKAIDVDKAVERAIRTGDTQKNIYGLKMESMTWLFAAEIVKDSIIKEKNS